MPQFGKIIYCIFLVSSQFLFSIAFLQTKMVHRLDFLRSGFAGMEYGGNRCFSSVLKSRAYNRIPSNFDTLDLWRLWKSSVVVITVQDGSVMLSGYMERNF